MNTLQSIPSQRLKQAPFQDLGSFCKASTFCFALLLKLFIYRAVRFSFLQQFFIFEAERHLHQGSPCSAIHLS